MAPKATILYPFTIPILLIPLLSSKGVQLGAFHCEVTLTLTPHPLMLLTYTTFYCTVFTHRSSMMHRFIIRCSCIPLKPRIPFIYCQTV